MVVLAVTWMANPGKASEVADVFRKLEAASRREPGCLLYVVHQHREDPGRFFIYEQYADEAALQAHRQSPHFHRHVSIDLKDIAVRVQGDHYVPLTQGSSM